MDKKLGAIITSCIWFAFFGYMLSSLVSQILKNTYRDGQIDAINGKIFYHLEKNEDGSTSWIYKEARKETNK